MKITVNYDFTQQELVGKTGVFEVAEGAGLGELLQLIDAKIIDTGKNILQAALEDQHPRSP